MDQDFIEEVKTKPLNFPYLAILGENEGMRLYLVAEQVVLTWVLLLFKWTTIPYCSLLVFNTEYPKPMYAPFIFLQHFVFKIRDKQAHTTTASMYDKFAGQYWSIGVIILWLKDCCNHSCCQMFISLEVHYVSSLIFLICCIHQKYTIPCISSEQIQGAPSGAVACIASTPTLAPPQCYTSTLS